MFLFYSEVFTAEISTIQHKKSPFLRVQKMMIFYFICFSSFSGYYPRPLRTEPLDPPRDPPLRTEDLLRGDDERLKDLLGLDERFTELLGRDLFTELFGLEFRTEERFLTVLLGLVLLTELRFRILLLLLFRTEDRRPISERE